MRRQIGILLFLISFLFITCGCGNKPYFKAEAEKEMVSYVEEKYGYTPEFEYIRWHREKEQNYIHSQGYYAKTTDGYYLRMNTFNDPKSFSIADTREYEQVQEAMSEYLKDNPLSEHYSLQLNPMEENISPTWNALKNAFTQKWEGDLQEFIQYQPFYKMIFILEGDSHPQFYWVLRVDDIKDYAYDEFAEYLQEVQTTFSNAKINVMIISPSVSEEAMKHLDFYSLWDRTDSSVILDKIWTGSSGLKHSYQEAVPITSEINGLKAYVLQGNNDEPFRQNGVLTVTEAEPLPDVTNFTWKYQALTPLFTINLPEGTNVVIDFDFTVLLKEYFANNKEAKLNTDFYILRVSEDGYANEEPIYLSSFSTEESAVEYFSKRYAHSFKINQHNKYFCIASQKN